MKSSSKNKIRHSIQSNIITAALTASLYCSYATTRQLVISRRAQCLLQMLSTASRLPIPSCFSRPARWKKLLSLEKKSTEPFSACLFPQRPPQPLFRPQRLRQRVLATRYSPVSLTTLLYLFIFTSDYGSRRGRKGRGNPRRFFLNIPGE